MKGAAASKIRTGLSVAVALAGAAVARAQPTVSIQDARVVERTTGGTWPLALTVTISPSAPSLIVIPWHTTNGSAVGGPGQDFDIVTNGTVQFNKDDTAATLTVYINGDSADEWDSNAPTDEAFFVDLDTPTVGSATLVKKRATVTIVDDDEQPYPPALQFVSAVADVPGSPPPGGRVRLQWRVPASSSWGPVNSVVVRWTLDSGSGCSAPAGVTGGMVAGEQTVLADAPDALQSITFTGEPLLRHCYALFAMYSSPPPMPPRAELSATPFDPAGDGGRAAAVVWAYSASSSTPNVVPPTVGLGAIYTISNDGVVHAMGRGDAAAGGGAWPPGWNPVGLGKKASNRSPVIPAPYDRLYVGTESGDVHAVDAKSGSITWSRSSKFGSPLWNTAGAVQAIPAGIFTNWTGLENELLVGSNNGTANNKFYVLDPVTGLDLYTPYTHSSMGGVGGMAVVDYTGNKVYFLTNSAAGTLFGLDLNPAKWTTFTQLLPAYPRGLAAGAAGSPVMRNGRLYFGVDVNLVFCGASDGVCRSQNLVDGPIKAFVFPDRRNNNKNVYVSTTNKVWGWKDDWDLPKDPPFTYLFTAVLPTPSIVLHWPGTSFAYVGGGDGRLYQIDVDSGDPPSVKSVMLDPNKQLGAPSLDGPNNLVLVGSESGGVYAVRVPLTVP